MFIDTRSALLFSDCNFLDGQGEAPRFSMRDGYCAPRAVDKNKKSIPVVVATMNRKLFIIIIWGKFKYINLLFFFISLKMTGRPRLPGDLFDGLDHMSATGRLL